MISVFNVILDVKIVLIMKTNAQVVINSRTGNSKTKVVYVNKGTLRLDKMFVKVFIE